MKTHHLNIIISVIIIITVFCVSVWLTGVIPQKVMANNNDTSDNLTREIQSIQKQFGISKWELNPEKNEIVIYVYDVQDENVLEELQGKPVENMTIKAIHDTDFENTRTEVTQYLSSLRHNNPDYQIARISMVTDAFGDPPGNYAELWVYNATPENQKLDGTSILDWTILVYPMAPLPV